MDYADIIIKVLIAALIGSIIGFERERHGKHAGLKTHMIVCAGACIVAIVQVLLMKENINLIVEHPELAGVISVDSSRMTAQVISGIGFLGAGCILQNKNDSIITGLTTAATLWFVACVGIAIGYGYIILGIISIFIIIVLRFIVGFIQTRLIKTMPFNKLQESNESKNQEMRFIENNELNNANDEEVKTDITLDEIE